MVHCFPNSDVYSHLKLVHTHSKHFFICLLQFIPLLVTTSRWKYEGISQFISIDGVVYENFIFSCVWWLTLVIPALWEAKVGGLLKARNSRPAWATRVKETLYKKK